MKRMMSRFSRIAFAVSLPLIFLAAPLRAANWFPLGPYGGDARSFAADLHNPQHLYLGTATGWIYESHDGGNSWNRVAQIADRNDLHPQGLVPQDADIVKPAPDFDGDLIKLRAAKQNRS